VTQLAIVDNVSLPISHSLQASKLVLQFPPFNSSLFYDPLIRLAELLGGGGGGGRSSNHEPLIIGLVVGVVSLALLLVLGAIIVDLVVQGKKKQHRRSKMASLFAGLSK